MTRLFHDLGSHPAGRPYECIPCLPLFQGGRDPEVTDKYVSIHVHQNVACLDITVNLLVIMEVMQALESLLKDSSNDLFILNTVGELNLEDIEAGTRRHYRHY